MLVEWKEKGKRGVKACRCGWIVASHVRGRDLMLTVAIPDGTIVEVPAKECRIAKFELQGSGTGA